MANTLTNLIPAAYEALDIVSRELVGFTQAVTLDATSDRIAKGQTVYSPVAPANTAATITPAMTVTAASDQTIGTKSLTVDNYKVSGFNWTGEEAFSMDSGPGLRRIMVDQIAQCLRVHVNAIELAVSTAAQVGASRAYGTSATTPFASDLSAAAQLRKILDDNGAPASGRSMVLNTTAGANLRTLAQLTKVNEAGSADPLRRGVLLDIHGFAVRESAQILTTTAGTGTGYLINNVAGYAIGDTALTLDTGSGTIIAGDVITIGSHKYVVATALAANVVTIAAPGLRAAVANDAAVTVNAAYSANFGFSRNAISLATRLPKVVPNDAATDRQVITDPVSGISFELAMYPGYRMVKYEVAIAYGTAVMKTEHLATLLG